MILSPRRGRRIFVDRHICKARERRRSVPFAQGKRRPPPVASTESLGWLTTSGDLKISEIVDAPNWIVSFYMPRSIFAG